MSPRNYSESLLDMFPKVSWPMQATRRHPTDAALPAIFPTITVLRKRSYDIRIAVVLAKPLNAAFPLCFPCVSAAMACSIHREKRVSP